MKALLRLTAVLLLVAHATGCKPTEEQPGPASAEPIRIAAAYWPGTFWIDIANRKNWFAEAGLNAEVIDVNADFFGSFDKIAKGDLDSLGLPTYDFVRLNAQGHKVTGVIITDFATGAEGIAAQPGIHRIRDLRGKRVGLTENTYSEYVFSVVAERDGLPVSEVETVNIVGEVADEAFIQGKVDAVFAWEPVLSRAIAGVPGSNVLFTSAEMPGISGGVQCVRLEFLEKRPEDVRKLVRVWARATAFISENPDAAYAIVAEVNNVSVEDVRRFTALDRTLNVQDNLMTFSYTSGFDSIHGTIRKINDYMIEKGSTDLKLDSTEILNPSFIRELAGVEATAK